jgi:O-antigen/teichoic acid export membrane protein
VSVDAPDSSRSAANAPVNQPESLSRVAARGSMWMGAQAVLNKVATAASMYLVAQALSPAEMGMGSLAVSIVSFLTIIPPFVMCDVLVAHQSALGELVRRGARIANVVGVASAIATIALSPLIARFYTDYPVTELALLIAALGLRTSAWAYSSVPLAVLRAQMRYRKIVVLDGGIQLASTLLTLLLAVTGAGAAAIVLPYLIGTVARAIAFRWATGPLYAVRSIGDRGASHVSEIHLGRDFALAALAQYIHTAVVALPLLVLGRMSNEMQTGLFAFAMMLAVQATAVIAQQLGTVLQPVLGRLAHDPVRQVAGYARALRTLGFVAVPVALLQAALAEPLFALLFSPKWDEALQVFQILCISQGFVFALAPTLALIKAQARFRVTMIWQAIHFLCGLAAAIAVARSGALPMAVAMTVLWGVSVPLAIWLAGRPGALRAATALQLFAEPWLVALPVAVGVYALGGVLTPLGVWAQLGAILVGGPLAFALMIVLSRITHPEVYADLMSLGPFGRIARIFSRTRTRSEVAVRNDAERDRVEDDR